MGTHGEGSPSYVAAFPSLLSEELSTPAHVEMHRTLDELENRFSQHVKVTNSHTKLLFNFLERDLIEAAGEILKWSVKKQGEKDGDGGHLFDKGVEDLVLIGCMALGMPVDRPGLKAYKDLSRALIQARHDTVQFADLAALERVVANCNLAVETWPELKEKPDLKNQVKVVARYTEYKQLLPQCFQ